jgi:hypothetical protein
MRDVNASMQAGACLPRYFSSTANLLQFPNPVSSRIAVFFQPTYSKTRR